MKTLKRLPVILALLVTIVVSACSEIDVDPRGEGDGDPIVIKPKPSGSSVAPIDTVSIG